MSSPRDDRSYGSSGKLRRSPPGGDTQSFFQTGQGGIKLPPLNSAFPTSRSPVPATAYPSQYPQQRSSTTQARPDYSQASYGQWPSNTAPSQPMQPSYPAYGHQDPRYNTQQAYPGYASRATPAPPTDHYGSRRSPPPTSSRDERWVDSSYSHAPVMNEPIRSPTAAYPSAYSGFPTHQPPQPSYSYPPVPDPRSYPHSTSSMHVQPQHPPLAQYSTQERVAPRPDVHSSAAYPRNAPPVSAAPAYAEPIDIDDNPVKKKRKRADAAQLKVLNETYNRTAFPSTEERADLAKRLDMSPRSVQIWFQNKRQSMRQTSRQATTTTVSPGSHQPFAIASRPDEAPRGSSYGTSMPSGAPSGGSSYMPRPSSDSSRPPTSQSPPPAANRRSPEVPRWGRY